MSRIGSKVGEVRSRPARKGTAWFFNFGPKRVMRRFPGQRPENKANGKTVPLERRKDMSVQNSVAARESGGRMIGKSVGFERTRRITGYLVGTLDRFNNAKRSEEKDRVKHGA